MARKTYAHALMFGGAGILFFLCTAFGAADEAFQPYVEASRFLHEGGSRNIAANMFAAASARVPSTRLTKTAASLAEDLRRMAIEDDVFREPKNPSKLTQMERVDYLVFKLRDVAEQSVFSPGQTHVLSYSRTGAGPAVALWKEGKAAIPALLALLEDERPTRSFSGAMNGAYVLRYGDVVLQILEGIAGRRFDRQTIRGAYFLSAPQDLHRSIKADVEGWWSKNKGREETQWLRESLLETGVDHRGKRAQLWAGQRLIDLDSAAAAEFFQKLLQGQRDDDFLARLLLEAQAADHENPSPEQPAAADGEDAAAEP